MSWWEEWCDYIGLTVEDANLSVGLGKSRYARRHKRMKRSSSEVSENQHQSAVSVDADVACASDSSALEASAASAIRSTTTPGITNSAGHKISGTVSSPETSEDGKSLMSSSSISSSPTVPHVRSESVEVEAGNIPSSPQPSPIMRQLSMHNYGERPGPIDNADLCGDVAGSIKVNLKEGHGYVLVPPTLWRLLYQWYGVRGDKGNDVNGANVFKRTVIYPGRRFGIRMETMLLLLRQMVSTRLKISNLLYLSWQRSFTFHPFVQKVYV